MSAGAAPLRSEHVTAAVRAAAVRPEDDGPGAAGVQRYGIRVHHGRRGRVAVVRIPCSEDAEVSAHLAAERTFDLRVRWLVIDLSEVWAACDVPRLVEGLRRRAAHAGVGIALSGSDPRGGAGGQDNPGCPVFPTVPVALGTLGGL